MRVSSQKSIVASHLHSFGAPLNCAIAFGSICSGRDRVILVNASPQYRLDRECGSNLVGDDDDLDERICVFGIQCAVIVYYIVYNLFIVLAAWLSLQSKHLADDAVASLAPCQ